MEFIVWYSQLTGAAIRTVENDLSETGQFTRGPMEIGRDFLAETETFLPADQRHAAFSSLGAAGDVILCAAAIEATRALFDRVKRHT